MALAGALRQAARQEDGRPAFVIKGGVALELRLRERARATRDLDLILNQDGGDPGHAGGAAGGAVRRLHLSPQGKEYRMPNGAVRVKVQVSFLGSD